MNGNRKLLDAEIRVEIENLSVMENGSEEKARAVEHLAQLYKLRTDESKAMKDVLVAVGKIVIDGGVVIFGTALSLKAYDKWFDKGLQFEKEGVVTSTIFKGLLNFVKPNKK